MAHKYQNIIEQMTLEEKCSMLGGGTAFATRSYPRYGIPKMELSDGPHGLRKQGAGANHLGIGGSLPATCFPTAATMANSWDPALGEELGRALGEEAAAQHVSVLLGPGLNMKRSPLCGRNFEYFSEDPYLAGRMAAAYVRGIQSNGISACPKHFAANSQEFKRMASDSIVDERTLREIYLTGFEIAVKESHPRCIMTSYNRVNGVYANEHPHLLQDVLKKEWGYDGMIVTDWGGSNDHVEGVRCSDLEMPAPGGDPIRELVRAVRQSRLPESAVDDRLDELLGVMIPAAEVVDSFGGTFDMEAHHQLARRAAAQSVVLLKNKDHILPLENGTRVALIGDFADTPRYQGAGSSVVNPTRLDSLTGCITDTGLNYLGYAQGYKRHGGADAGLLQAAVELAKKADIVIYCMGLDEVKESEGLDRPSMKIDDNQIHVLHAIREVNSNVIAVLSGGSSVEMPWMDDCSAILDGYLGGQAGAGAMLDIITGKVNPSGKLSETFAMQYEDTPARRDYPARSRTSEYREGPYIGYRYYDTAGLKVRFPFGFGLSYTTFEYSDLEVKESGVSFNLKNTGGRDGAEIAQMYVHRHDNNADQQYIYRPERELKGFAKVFLKAGESTRVEIPFDDRTFRFFDIRDNSWHQEVWNWEIQIGASSRDICLTGDFVIREGQVLAFAGDKAVMAMSPYRPGSLGCYYSGSCADASDGEFEALLGHAIPSSKVEKIDENITFGELNHGRSPIGWLIWLVMTFMLKASLKRGTPNLNLLFIYNMPMRAMAKNAGQFFSMGMVRALTFEFKGGWVIGVVWFLVELVKNQVLNVMLESRLKSGK